MNCDILVSIVVPVYKVEKYLKRCIESIINQTYDNTEILLVDDGSPDDCGIICDDYAKIDKRIKVIHKSNGGLSDARNVAISMARGDYITCVDSDDFVTPVYIENLLNAALLTNADITSSWFMEYFDNQIITDFNISNNVEVKTFDSEGYLEKLLYQDGVETSAWGKLYKSDVLKANKYPVGKLYEDIPVTLKAINMSKKLSVISSIDYFYYQRGESIQSQEFNLRKMDAITHMNDLVQFVKIAYPRLTNAAYCRYFSTVCNIYFQVGNRSFQGQKQFLWNEIMTYREVVYRNTKVRMKSRLAALLTYFGPTVMTYIYNGIKN